MALAGPWRELPDLYETGPGGHRAGQSSEGIAA
jgi:hypothetical protein